MYDQEVVPVAETYEPLSNFTWTCWIPEPKSEAVPCIVGLLLFIAVLFTGDVTATAGGIVSTVIVIEVDGVDTFPLESVAVAVMILGPWASLETATFQLPLESDDVVPTSVVDPLYTLMITLASAVPEIDCGNVLVI